MTDLFDEARRLVSAREVAELNGLHPNRSGFVCCPFHREKTPSLKFYPDGGWKCFGCGKGGNGSIDFVAALYDLTPLEAVRRLNEDFRLALPLDKPPDSETLRAAQHRREISDTYRLFEEWRGSMIQQLNACFREGHLAMKSLETPVDLDRLTDAQALAIREQARVEWLTDTLTGGTMADMMQVFRDRKAVDSLCGKILNHMPTKSGAA